MFPCPNLQLETFRMNKLDIHELCKQNLWDKCVLSFATRTPDEFLNVCIICNILEEISRRGCAMAA